MKNKSIVIVSDSTGETAIQITNAIKVHFDTKNTNILRYPDILTILEIDEMLEDLSGDTLIFSTIVRKDLLDYLKEKSSKSFLTIVEKIYLVIL